MQNAYGAGIGVLVGGTVTPVEAAYDLEVAEAGEYVIEMRYAAADPRPVRVLYGDRVLAAQALMQTTGGWMPEHQAWTVVARVQLAVGAGTLRLEAERALPHIDKIRLRRASP
jgi:hypothetical protein